MTSLDDLKGDSGSTPSDGAAQDGATNDSQTSDAGSGNLLTNGSFELGQGGCGSDWGNGYGMTFTRVSPGHTGQYACLVCMQGGGDSYELDNIAPVTVSAGSYYVEAWVLASDGGVAGDPGVQVYLADGGDDGGMQGCTGGGAYCQGSFFTAPAAWTASSTTFSLAAGGVLKIDMHSYMGNGSCFIVDDVAVFAQ